MAETIEADDESWSEVIVTLAISTATSAVFLTIYEVARRNPSLIEVFDRRRATKPNRTPPPLLRNSIFEWLFMSSDPVYSEYSDLAHMRDVILEKRKQRNPHQVGFFGTWIGNGRKTKENQGNHNDIDNHNDNHNDNDNHSHSNNRDDEEQAMPISPNQTRRQRHNRDNVVLNTNSYGVEINIGTNDNQHQQQHQQQQQLRRKKINSAHSSRRSRHSNSTGDNSLKDHQKKIIIRRHLTPDVVEVNGWRLPKEVGEYAMANDLSEEQLYDYEDRLLEQERLDEIEFQQRRNDVADDGWMRGSDTGNFKHQLEDAALEELESDIKLRLPPRRSRFWFLGFGHNSISGLQAHENGSAGRPNSAATTESQRASRMGKPVALLRSVLSSRYSMNAGVNLTQHDSNENVHLNRHLKSVSVLRKRPLSVSDSELLRCIGLDTFVMIRFLRFCFDITFYPFILACIVLFPTYAYNNFQGEIESGENMVKTQTDGYFLLTINRLEPTSKKLWICWGYSILYLLFILRRVWIEWETFLPLRFDFLANGDVENEKPIKNKNYNSRNVVEPQKDAQLHLEQYRNSCLVEYIPDSHRRDRELFQFFDAVFPGQVKRAEILLNATELTNLIKMRQEVIVKYERISAKHSYEKKRYWQIKEGAYSELERPCWECLSCRSCRRGPKKPEDPTIQLGKSGLFCCQKKAVKALPHFLAEIKRLNRKIDSEYKKVIEEKQTVEDRLEYNDLIHNTVGVAKTFLTGEGSDLKCDTGFVEFMSLTAKQSALQCNITGTNGFMLMTSAPDPRDIVWDNATVEKQSIAVKNSQCGLLLFTGTLFWFAVVGFVTSLSNLDQIKEKKFLPESFFPAEDSILYDLMQGYIPVILLESLMLVVPFTLKIIAKKFIRFKTHSEIDQFMYKWHFAFRITNLISIIVRQQVLKTLDLFVTSPRSTVDYLAGNIALSSQFFLNNMLVSAGTETFFEISQITKICRHVIMNKFITIEATSKRDLERIQEPISLEWGETVPPFIFALLVSSIYSTVVPIVMGACALYFYVAAKIYTHQALFIYAQPYEGGGKLMYLLNRSVFGIIYIYILFFAAILGLKNAGLHSVVSFLVIMFIITYVVDRWITTTFVNPSSTLALTNARIIDEETKARNERKRLYREFKNAKKRKKKEEAQSSTTITQVKSISRISRNKENYLPNALLPPLPESRATNSGDSKSRSSNSTTNSDREDFVMANRMKLKKARESRPRGSPDGELSSRSSFESGGSDDPTDDGKPEFYLYRQPQLNKTLWETKPRTENW